VIQAHERLSCVVANSERIGCYLKLAVGFIECQNARDTGEPKCSSNLTTHPFRGIGLERSPDEINDDAMREKK
jgi:hypothetical protein